APALARRHRAEPPAQHLGVDQPFDCRPRRPLCPARVRRPLPRPADLLAVAAPEYETHEHDVIVIGAGGAGLRAAIESSSLGAKTAVICKSLLGKAHTVMAEG